MTIFKDFKKSKELEEAIKRGKSDDKELTDLLKIISLIKDLKKEEKISLPPLVLPEKEAPIFLPRRSFYRKLAFSLAIVLAIFVAPFYLLNRNKSFSPLNRKVIAKERETIASNPPTKNIEKAAKIEKMIFSGERISGLSQEEINNDLKKMAKKETSRSLGDIINQ